MAITMEDVARYAAVSTATVSRVLNSPEVVNEETRQRVLDAIEKLNYRRNPIARSLRTQRAQQVAVVAEMLRDPLLVAILEAFEATAQRHGYSVSFTLTHFDENYARHHLERLIQKHYCDAVLWLARNTAHGILKRLAHHKVPSLLVNDTSEHLPSLSFDYHAATYTATKYLLEMGHRQIELWTSDSQLEQKGEGFQKAFREWDLSSPSHYMTVFGSSTGDTEQAVYDSLSRATLPSALLVYGDELTAQVYHWFAAKGWRIPEQLSVVACTNSSLSLYWYPRLTRIQLPAVELGQTAFYTLLKMLQGDYDPAKAPALPIPRLIVRDSVARV